jgi:hypothetical protein
LEILLSPTPTSFVLDVDIGQLRSNSALRLNHQLIGIDEKAPQGGFVPQNWKFC